MGVPLFQAKNDIAKMRELLAKPIPLPSSINAAVPRELDRIVMKALDVDPTSATRRRPPWPPISSAR